MKFILHSIRPYVVLGIAVFYYWLFLRGSARKRTPSRVLIIPQLTRIGDLVCTTPVFRAIKETYPNSYLAVMVAESSRTEFVIKHNPYVDEVIVLKNSEYHQIFGVLRFFKRIREKRFDCSVNLSASLFGTLVSVWGRVPKRIKVVREHRPFSERISDWMNTDYVFYADGEHIPTLYLNALEPLHIPFPQQIRKEVFAAKEGERAVEQFLHDRGVAKSDMLVGISVTAGNSIKEWGVDKFAELSRALVARYGMTIIFIGGPGDTEVCKETNRLSGGKGIVATEFTLEELPALLARLTIFISVDCGPMHMAHAVGTPLIDIIGPVDPSEQAPSDQYSVIVRPPEEIKPTIFAFRSPGDPKETQRALDAISVEDVLRAFETLMQRLNRQKNDRKAESN